MHIKGIKQRWKALLLIFGSLAVLLLVLLIGSKLILLNSFLEIEKKSMEKNMDRALNAYNSEISHLSTINGDYAGWDESYRFIQDGNKEFIETNLADTIFPQLRINLMIYVTNAGKIFYAKGFDQNLRKTIPVPKSMLSHISAMSPLVRHTSPESILTGILPLPEGLLMIASRPVLTNEYKGPIHGALIIGRYLDAHEIGLLSGTTKLSMKIFRIDDQKMPADFMMAGKTLSDTTPVLIRPLNRESVAAYTQVKDIYGKGAFIMRVDTPRNIYRQGIETIRYFIMWFLIVGLIFAVISYLLFEKMVFFRRKGIESEEQLAHQVNHDSLTGLPNRNLLHDRMNQAIAYQRRMEHIFAVMFIDIDHFKVIKDTLGHPAGDLLLQDVAQRLRGAVRGYDTVARVGGDEFVILSADIAHTKDVITIARNLLDLFLSPFQLKGQEVFITVSIGISLYPSDGDSVESLLMKADTAMYNCKEQGRNNYQFFAEEMNKKVSDRLALETSLHRALEREEFLLHYQPRVDLTSGHICGMEALIRWDHPESGIISPMDFIPLAEETGLIIPIGEWVLRNACRQNRLWQDEGYPPLRVSVNLSTRQFLQPDLVEMVRDTLGKTGLDPHHLEIELTESLLMQNEEKNIQKLRALKEMGIVISIDDFGTGYSSLGYLRRFPIDKVKIDRSFVQDIPGNQDGATIVKTILAMTHTLKLKAVAEGVETREQMTFLIEHDCEEMQGYYFSRPLPPEAFAQILTSGRHLEEVRFHTRIAL